LIEEPVERRLEIILASDIAGYSRLRSRGDKPPDPDDQ
jgi:hypothetical protein